MGKYQERVRDWVVGSFVGGLSAGAAHYLFDLLARRFAVEAIRVDGDLGRFEGRPNDLVMGSYLRYRTYGPDLLELIRDDLLGQGGTLVDIGANIGLVCVPVARRGLARVIAFEPEPVNFGFLRANLAANAPDAAAELHNLAIFSADRTLTFELSENNLGDHRVRRKTDLSYEKYAESRRPVIQVEGRRLDGVLDPRDLPRPIVVKIDTQGAEVDVVAGGAHFLAAADYVIAEYCPYLIRRLNADPAAFLDFVRTFPRGGLLVPGQARQTVPGDIEALVAAMTAFPQDGSAARHVDVLLAR